MPNPNADAVSPGEFVLHYRIQQRLGAGGMGVVYKALDTRLGRSVALKFLPINLGGDFSSRERLLREAMAASAIDHPNMGAVHAIEDAGDNRPFIVMAYYEGETLRARLDRGPLPPAQAIDIALQTARGLACAHELGIIHRDIKPSNLILTRDGTVKIVDFGLAKISGAGDLTKTGTTIGTAAYMSPEQAVHTAIDHRTDLWSLGVVLHEMLGGDVPFHGESALAQLYAVVHQEPDPLLGAPPALAAIAARCLRKPAQERYATARELMEALERARSGLYAGVPTETVTMVKPERSAGRKPLMMALLAIALLVCAGLLWLILSRSRGTSPPKIEVAATAVPPPPPAEKTKPAVEAQTTPPKAQPTPGEPKLPPLRRALSASEYGGPLRGELQWSGTLANRETLTLQAGHVVSGSLSDDLPLAPINIEVEPSGVEVIEKPSPRNQWDRLVLRNASGSPITKITIRWRIARQ